LKFEYLQYTVGAGHKRAAEEEDTDTDATISRSNRRRSFFTGSPFGVKALKPLAQAITFVYALFMPLW
jgi:hypothetical protein